MTFKEIIHRFDLAHFNHALANDTGELRILHEVMFARTFTGSDVLGQDGRALDRKLLYTWKEKGVLPYATGDGWARFHFVELCWLRVVMELRQLGVGFERILKLKDHFFHDEEYLRLIYNRNVTDVEDKSILPNLKSGIVDESGIMIPFEEFKRDRTPESVSRFFHVLLGIIFTRHNVFMRLDGKGAVEFYDLETYFDQETDSTVPSWKELFLGPSFVMINLTNIIREVSQTHDVFNIKDDQLLVKQSAIDVIKKLFKENSISEIRIRLADDNRPLIEIKQKLSFKELNQKVYSLQRKGVFRDLVIKTRDGKVQHFESTDLIKL